MSSSLVGVDCIRIFVLPWHQCLQLLLVLEESRHGNYENLVTQRGSKGWHLNYFTVKWTEVCRWTPVWRGSDGFWRLILMLVFEVRVNHLHQSWDTNRQNVSMLAWYVYAYWRAIITTFTVFHLKLSLLTFIHNSMLYGLTLAALIDFIQVVKKQQTKMLKT